MRRPRMRWALLSAAASILAVAVVIVALAARNGGPSRAVSPPASAPMGRQQAALTHQKGVTEDCSTRSEADFGPAFTDSANLVVGPLAMMGGATFTSASVVRRVNGQKYPLLVKAGHRVTIEVPASARKFVALGYGPLPQGEITLAVAHPRVTFIPCARDEPSGSRAGGPVTFWSGGLVANEPHCVPLDVFVDGEATPHRVFIALGAVCARTA